MSPRTRNALLGMVVGFLVEAVLTWQGLRPHHHPMSSLMIAFPAFGLGYATYSLLNFFSGNRKVTNASPAVRQAALAGQPPAGQGLVYIYRDAFIGRAIGFDILMDGTYVAQLKTPRFTRVVVPAGDHVLVASRESTGSIKHTPGSLRFSLAAGMTAIFRIDAGTGLRGAIMYVRWDPDPAQTMVKLAGMTMVLAETPVLAAGAPPPPRV